MSLATSRTISHRIQSYCIDLPQMNLNFNRLKSFLASFSVSVALSVKFAIDSKTENIMSTKLIKHCDFFLKTFLTCEDSIHFFRNDSAWFHFYCLQTVVIIKSLHYLAMFLLSDKLSFEAHVIQYNMIKIEKMDNAFNLWLFGMGFLSLYYLRKLFYSNNSSSLLLHHILIRHNGLSFFLEEKVNQQNIYVWLENLAIKVLLWWKLIYIMISEYVVSLM